MSDKERLPELLRRWAAEVASKAPDDQMVQIHRLTVLETAEELDRLRADLERERMRLAACGVVAMANTEESAKEQRLIHPDYQSDSLNCVIRAVDEEMKLRAENAELRTKIDTAAKMCEREYGCEQLAPEIRELLN